MIIAVLIMLGLCFGSFTNALVWRLHEQKQGKNSKKTKAELSIVKGRSMCPHCRHTLGAKDLLPVLSWIELRGKCRYCQKPISAQYPLVELTTVILFVVSYLVWPYDFSAAEIVSFGFWLVILIFFMSLCLYDLKWMLLPNKVVYPLIGVVALSVIAQAILNMSLSPAIEGLWGVLCLAGLFYALFQISGGKWIGGGDVKLAIALGLLVGGPIKAFLLLFVASVLGVLVTLPLLIKGQKKYTSKIPFGPFLLGATIIVYLFGTVLVDWYLQHILQS